MKTRFVIAILFLAGLLALCGIYAEASYAATSFEITSVARPTSGVYDLSYANGRLLGVKNGVIGEVSLGDGSWNTYGVSGRMATWTSRGMAFYDSQGCPNLRQGSTITKLSDTEFGTPIRSATNPDGDITFGNVSTDFLMINQETQPNEGILPFNFIEGSWWITSAGYAPNGHLFVAGQNTANPIQNGYRVCAITPGGSKYDTGLTYSEIAVGDGYLWGVASDHSYLEAWKLGPDGIISNHRVHEGGYFNLYGADGSGALYSQGTLYWHANAVPEPTGFMALGTGLLSIFSIIKRRKR